MNSQPQLSVIMVVKNCADFLQEAVDSVLLQSMWDFEFIIVDDASSDGTLEMLQAASQKDGRIRLLTHPTKGLTAGLNVALKLVRSEFTARMDGDDVCLPTRFEKQLSYLHTHPECVAVGSEVMMIDAQGRKISPRSHPSFHDGIRRRLLVGDGAAMTHPTIMMRTVSVNQVGGYDERFETAQDLDIFLKLGEVGQLHNLSETLLLWRQHRASVNHTKHHTWRRLKALAVSETIKRIGAESYGAALFIEQEAPTLAQTDLQIAERAFYSGNSSTAVSYLLRSLCSPELRLTALRRALRWAPQLLISNFRRIAKA
jgi:glycosyltransferase involved in cell wall biosynthesis